MRNEEKELLKRVKDIETANVWFTGIISVVWFFLVVVFWFAKRHYFIDVAAHIVLVGGGGLLLVSYNLAHVVKMIIIRRSYLKDI